jgi:hypothetical protein
LKNTEFDEDERLLTGNAVFLGDGITPGSFFNWMLMRAIPNKNMDIFIASRIWR